MSMFNDIELSKIGKEEHVSHAEEVAYCAKLFQKSHRFFCGPVEKRMWCRTCFDKPNAAWNHIGVMMPQQFPSAKFPICFVAATFMESDLKCTRSRETTHFQNTTQTKIFRATNYVFTVQYVNGLTTTVQTL